MMAEGACEVKRLAVEMGWQATNGSPGAVPAPAGAGTAEREASRAG